MLLAAVMLNSMFIFRSWTPLAVIFVGTGLLSFLFVFWALAGYRCPACRAWLFTDPWEGAMPLLNPKACPRCHVSLRD